MVFDRKQYMKEWRIKNNEKVKENKKRWDEENKEHIRQYEKDYNKTPAGIKRYIIHSWKYVGVISNDYSSLYEYYLNCKDCEECGIELQIGNVVNKKCLDHDHITGLFRNVLCNSCNLRRH